MSNKILLFLMLTERMFYCICLDCPLHTGHRHLICSMIPSLHIEQLMLLDFTLCCMTSAADSIIGPLTISSL